MYCVKRISDDLFWVGGTDRRPALFESAYPTPRRASYNAHLLLDEKAVLFDTVDRAVMEQFFENIDALLKGRALDYVVVSHMESDHYATLGEIVPRYPGIQVVCNPKTILIIRQLYNLDIDPRATVVEENDTLYTGRYTFTFLVVPMAYWPEVMVTCDTTNRTLFSADVFGTFGAMNGNLFTNKVDFERDWLNDTRRYYTNVMSKYGPSVQIPLKKASGLDIRTLCPLHGPVQREDISWHVDKYLTWSSHEPEEKAMMIAYDSIHGNMENAANILTCKLAERGIRSIAMCGTFSTHPFTTISGAFRCNHLTFAPTIYNGGIFNSVEHVPMDLKAHDLQSRTVALMKNGSWGVLSGEQVKEIIGSMKSMTIPEQMMTVKSSLKESQIEELDSIADAIAESTKQQF